MRKLLLLIAVFFMFCVAYNIDIIQHRRSHIKRNIVPKKNYTGWSKGTSHKVPDYTKGISPLFIRLRDEI